MKNLKFLIVVPLLVFVLSCSSEPTRKQSSKSDHARMYLEIANAALLEGDPTGALQQIAKAEAEDPNLPDLWHSKGLAYVEKRDLPTAIECFRKAVTLKPDYADANNSLGKYLMDGGRSQEAIKYLTTAASNPLYVDAYRPLTNLGILYYRRGEYSKSEEYLKKATIADANRSCIANYYIGHIRLKESRFDEAVRSYDQATRRFCASFADAHLAIGIAYEESKQYNLARKKFLEVQKRYPNTQVAEHAMERLRYLP